MELNVELILQLLPQHAIFSFELSQNRMGDRLSLPARYPNNGITIRTVGTFTHAYGFPTR